MKKGLGTITMMALLLLILAASPAKSQNSALSEEAQKCLSCHARHGIVKTFENKDSLEAYVDSEKFKDSAHGSLKCSDCHTDFTGEKHPQRRFRSKEQYKIKSAMTCRRCHRCEQIKTKSIHSRLLTEEESGMSHPCTNCHGSHNIISTRSTDPAIVKANLVRRCQQCHKDAAKNFPDAWLSHYEPTLANTPLVFIITMIYRIFTPIMVIGIILQILLHIWRYAVNR